MTAPRLALADLEAHDPRAPAGGVERRFCCPLPPCADKPVDAAHRSLSVNLRTGAWTCHRCKSAGRLVDRPDDRRRLPLSRVLQRPTPPIDPQRRAQVQSLLERAGPVRATPGERYLQQRGIPLSHAVAADVRFHPDWFGAPAVVFPLQDDHGHYVAAQGRYLRPDATPKTRTIGPRKRGLFATAGARASATIVLTEAPIDALSLAAIGTPAVAFCGVDPPDWLPRLIAFKTVALAFDADPAGDAAADALLPLLRSFGATPKRLRPTHGKDWNDQLLQLWLPDGLVLPTPTDS